MRTLALVVSAVLACGLPPVFSADTNEEKPKAPALEDIIFNAAMFTAKLPKKTLIFATPKRRDEVQTAIKTLGPTPDVEFYLLPPEAEKPVIKSQGPPVYPDKVPDDGEASFLVLISASGRVSNIYCYHSTHHAFAINAAEALARWRFSPAQLQKTAVPVLFAQTIYFKRGD